MPPREQHKAQNTGWLRAAVLGANDGLISTAGLVMGVAAASSDSDTILLSGVAGLVAGAISMAAGEYVSVSSQADAEKADLAMERAALDAAPDEELEELKAIYIGRGLTADLAQQVAEQLSAGDVLLAHARDELGMFDHTRARPVQAAFASAGAFIAGAAVPAGMVTIVPVASIRLAVAASTLVLLFGLGMFAARLGGARAIMGGLRVAFWGATAMTVTSLVGRLFGSVV
jgi:VIT1/CCC1 family predicted Fe2+/Mn2+ transporter